MIFSLAGVKFEDYRITYEDWPKFKTGKQNIMDKECSLFLYYG